MSRALRSLGLAALVVAGVVLLSVSASMSTVVALLLSVPPHALVMGGNNNPDPSPDYVDGMVDNYIAVAFPAGDRYPVHTPEEFWPVNGTLTFDQSTVQGVTDLESEMAGAQHAHAPLVILGYSSSTRIASVEKNRLIAAQDYDREISFVLLSDVNKGNGGILARFPGWTIPILGVTFDGATRTDSLDSAFHTTSITIVHDGWSDFPIYPANMLAVANGMAGIVLLHPTYPNLDQPELTPIGSTGDTDYYVIETEIVPILLPLGQVGVPRPILLALDEPIRVLIEAGYRRDIDPGAPTPAYLIPVVNPVSLVTNVVAAIPVGVDDALQASNLGRPLGTQPSGPFGVGGEDADLEGLPAGFIPLGKPPTKSPAALPDPIEADSTRTDLKEIDSTEADLGEADLGEADLAEVDLKQTDEPVTTPAKPKPLRPKVRAPIRFDAPRLLTLPTSQKRPLKRVADALTRPRTQSATSDTRKSPAKAVEKAVQQAISRATNRSKSPAAGESP